MDHLLDSWLSIKKICAYLGVRDDAVYRWSNMLVGEAGQAVLHREGALRYTTGVIALGAEYA